MPSSNISLEKAIDEFMTSPASSYTMRSHLTRFSMVCGKTCPMFALSPSDVKECLRETKKAADKRSRALALETFFEFSKENGWVQSNIAAGLIKQPQKKKPAPKVEMAAPSTREIIYLTPEGRQEIEEEVEQLTARKEIVIAEVAAAREEGDLKENAGYHDARERLGLIEGQLKEKKDLLSKAVTKE